MSNEVTPKITMDPRVHIRSTWREAIGPLLTNRRITMRMRQGWYEETAKQKSMANATPTHGIVYRCECGCKKEVRYVTFSYMPRRGYWCPRCIAVHGKETKLARELAARVREQQQKLAESVFI